MTINLLKDCKVCLRLIPTSELRHTMYEKAWQIMLSDWRVGLHTGRDSKKKKNLWQQRQQEQPTATTLIVFFLHFMINSSRGTNCRLGNVNDFNLSSTLAGCHFVRYGWNDCVSIYSPTIHSIYSREILLLILLNLLCFVAMTPRKRKVKTL